MAIIGDSMGTHFGVYRCSSEWRDTFAWGDNYARGDTVPSHFGCLNIVLPIIALVSAYSMPYPSTGQQFSLGDFNL